MAVLSLAQWKKKHAAVGLSPAEALKRYAAYRRAQPTGKKFTSPGSPGAPSSPSKISFQTPSPPPTTKKKFGTPAKKKVTPKKKRGPVAKPKGKTPAKPPAAAAPPQATPPDPNQAAEDQITAAMGALHGQYNPVRQQDAVLAAQNLVGAGYYDSTPGATTSINKNGQVVQAPTALQIQANQMSHGDVLYNIVAGADGQLYRQGYMKIAHSGAARGESSSYENQIASQNLQQQLDTKRGLAMQKADTAQTSSLAKEQSTYTSDADKLASLIAKGTASQVKTASQTPAGTAPTTPTTPSTTPTTPKPKTPKPKAPPKPKVPKPPKPKLPPKPKH